MVTANPQHGTVPVDDHIQLPVVQAITERLSTLDSTHAKAIQATAALFANVIEHGGLIHVFGSGHSHMLVEELFFRAGGLLNFNAMLDPSLMLHVSATAAGEIERLPDFGRIVMDKYTFGPHDAMLVISYSGINAVPIDIALLGKARAMPVVVLTSIEASRSTDARHSSGQRLCDIGDIVLDNPGPRGDASIKLDGLDAAICALSTIMGATILQSVVHETTRLLIEHGHVPAVLRSANVNDQDAGNEALIAQFRSRLDHL